MPTLATFVHISNISAVIGPSLDPIVWGHNFCGPELFGPKHFLDLKLFLPHFFPHRTFFRTKFYLPNILLDQAFFRPNIYLDPTFFWTQHFFKPNIFSHSITKDLRCPKKFPDPKFWRPRDLDTWRAIKPSQAEHFRFKSCLPIFE